MPILKNNANIHGLTIDTVKLSDIKQNEANWIFDTGNIQTISFTNAIFVNVTSQDNEDQTSGILLINSLDLNSKFDIGISSVQISNSSTNFISFSSVMNTPPAIKYLEIHNYTYINSYIETDRKLLSTESIEADENLIIVLNMITFNNISFSKTGSLISFGHQLSDYVQVKGIVIKTIDSGKIKVESTNQQNSDLLAYVNIQDSEFDTINDQYSSLIIIGKGARLNVTNSSFTNIYTYEEGAVVFAGPTATEVNFHDVIFINNSAVTGALFHIEAESVVR